MNKILHFLGMHDIKADYDKTVEIVETFFKNEMAANENFRFCPAPDAGQAGHLHIGGDLSLEEDVSIVDSMPVPVCKLSGEHRTKA